MHRKVLRRLFWHGRRPTALAVVVAILLQAVLLPAAPGPALAGAPLFAAGDICHAAGSGPVELPGPAVPQPGHRHEHCLLCQLGGAALPVHAAAPMVQLSAVLPADSLPPSLAGSPGLVWRPYAPRAPPRNG